ncbi:MAG: FapA family protein [Firmicutes bacterium]|jgi:uncharacterized protein (DUF342 family)|nr:FapA family protein [Bacillota bacterium]
MAENDKDVILDDKDYQIKVEISEDSYEAYITIDFFTEDEVIVTKSEILEAINTSGVVFGLKDESVDLIAQNPRIANKMPIASGIKHEDGKDAVIEYLIDFEGKNKPKELHNGKVDFKDMSFVHVCEKDDVIAVKKPAEEGTDGKTVTGKVVKAKIGKDQVLKIGKNTVLSEDGLKLIAAADGNAKFIAGKVDIIEVLEIQGDVGVKTGNISFNGRLVINGNITTGFRVVSQNDIEINGIVESAQVYSNGNIVIKGGVQGNDDAVLRAGGDIHANYINSALVYAKGDIHADSIMHCDVTSDGSIISHGKKGMIVGGEIKVRKHIDARTVGAEMGTITKLTLGVDSKISEEYQALQSEIKDFKENITKLNQALNLIRKQLQASPGNPEITNIMNKTMVTKDEYNEKLKASMERFKELNELIESLMGAYVSAEEFFPGVKIKIGNSHYVVKTKMDNTTIKKSEGEIRTFARS